MTPAPFAPHQRLVAKLFIIIQKYLEKHPLGEVILSPMDVIFEDGVNRLQPDLLFVGNEKKSIIQDWVRGVPDIVVEIVSRGTVTRDTVEKKAIYERYQVPELWLVFPELQCVEIFFCENGSYRIHSSTDLSPSGAKSKLLNGLILTLDELFPSR
ncbi:putative restriction endonuclease [Leptospira alstonii serovar Sichuan str. 79601]|uniref:Putative restriction endonuclease n=1 Tax=Leptospira alstonii serovar Sichuan str. 79601 TaxID=1218565 RepID=M6D0W5_9LEPT|nr:putative restriction endonuclease [Leptospira alstonii serovar Sichuan str. 79601]